MAKLCSAFLGLTLLAAAYAEKHRSDYRATWWIRRRPRPPCAPISSRSAYGSAGLADDKENDVLADVMERVSKVIAQVEPHDSAERYTALGVECLKGTAKITSPPPAIPA